MQPSDYMVIPYTAHDGVPTFRNSEIKGWFERIEAERSVRWVFFDGSVADADGFLSLARRSDVLMCAVWRVESNEMVGFFWLTPFVGAAGFLHFCVFKKFWGAESYPIGRCALAFVLGLDGETPRTPAVGMVLGGTPTNNPAALKFIIRIGVKRLGVVPGMFYDVFDQAAVDGLLTYMDRATFAATEKE